MLIFITSAAAADLPKIKLKVAQAMMPKTSLTHKLIEEMSSNVTERTGGKVTWMIFGPEIGDWTELERMAKRGAVDMQFNAADTSLDPRWNITYLPFSVSSWDQVRKVFVKDGVINQICAPWAEEKGLKYIGPWLNNMASMGLKKKVVTATEQAKGLKIRVPPVSIAKCYVEKMGFSSVTVPWAETPTAVATGLVDGWMGSGAVYMYDLFRDVANVLVATYDTPETWHVTFNLEKWNSLPTEYQNIIQEESEAIISKHLALVEKEELEYQAKLKQAGWTIIDMAKDHPAELAKWVKSGQECWEEFAEFFGVENLEKLKKAGAE